MPLRDKLSLGLALLLWTQVGVAQSNLGELLDAGAKRLSAEEFRQEVVQRTMQGPTPTGGAMEIMYVSNGSVQGSGTPPNAFSAGGPWAQFDGTWTTDADERVCASMRIASGPGGYGSILGTSLPNRCQFWFKLGDRYFFSDSDTDRRARLLSRTFVK